MRQRCDLNGSRNDGVVATVSALALIVLYAMLVSFAQEARVPIASLKALRTGFVASWRIVTTGCDGAMLKRGDTSTRRKRRSASQVLLKTSQPVPATHAPDYRRFSHAGLGGRVRSEDPLQFVEG